MPTPTLTAILTLGLFAAGLTLILRAVAPQPWLLHKPLSCDLCMSWWGSVVGALVQLVGAGSGAGEAASVSIAAVAPAVVAAVAVSVLLLKAINRLDVL